MRTVLAIDQGTTGSTCLVVTDDGRVLGRGYREITQHYPQPGWVEHDADELVGRTLEAAREALEAAGVVPDCIGITNQRETVVVWDRATGAPVHRAIVWQDRRTAARCEELAPQAATIGAMTGLVVDPYFSATKLEWLLARGDLRARARRGELLAGTVDTWLIWRLTGGAVHATDPTNASRTMLFDTAVLAWSDELCARFGVPESMLAEVRPSSGDFGVAMGDLLGLPRDVPITGVAGDQQAALFGHGCWKAGEGKNTYGTGAFLLLNTGGFRPAPGGGMLVTVACDAHGKPCWALEGAIFVAGAAVQWLRDGLGILDHANESEALARGIETTDGVYFVPALTGLGAPDWEPAARGTITGLTRGTTRAHLARAALEAMAYGTRDVLDAMRERGGSAVRTFGASALRADGGATANDWLMQFQADVLGVPLERPAMVEMTAFGAAGLAGLAAGVWSSAAAFASTREVTRWEPGGAGEDAQRVATEGHRGWRRAVRATLAWARDGG
jgi:glycerol kinase